LPLREAAQKLGIGTTLLKKLCRQLGIDKWPSRKRAGIRQLIEHLEGTDERVIGVRGALVSLL